MNRAALLPLALTCVPLLAQPYGTPDRGEPADAMIQAYLTQETERIESEFNPGQGWLEHRAGFHREYMDMLGLQPPPEKSPLSATLTGTLDRGDYQVDLLHYQSRPGLYVTANLYRPTQVQSGTRLPAILYVCGHSSRGRDGNKTAFQSHGIWFARHGYVCLIVDTLQLGEIAGIHHGTYREGRWWWLSRGYTPAGVECWNGIRGIDYLISRPDVDPERIGVTGISGGGAATFWIAAADQRVRVAVPVSGMADLHSYVPNRVVNGHCDCMFLYNTYQWPWTRIAALIAPRPMLFVNSDQDPIFPMDANERVINRLEQVYSLFGAGDRVDSLVSIGGHDYRADIRQATYRFFNTHFKNDPRPVLDSEVDLVTGQEPDRHPIPPEQLRVFPTALPADERNSRIDSEFVPVAQVGSPEPREYSSWKAGLLNKLKTLTFHHFPQRIPPAVRKETGQVQLLETEPGVVVRLRQSQTGVPGRGKVWLAVADLTGEPPEWLKETVAANDVVFLCELRGTGNRRWTAKNPPNHVERSHYLLGRTVDSGRVWDLAALARYLHDQQPSPVHLVGEGADAILALYAALLEPDIAGLTAIRPPESHMVSSAPALLNVLRVLDIPDALGLLAPRPLTLVGASAECSDRATTLYRAAEAHIVVRPK